jgi:hypothetical protein
MSLKLTDYIIWEIFLVYIDDGDDFNDSDGGIGLYTYNVPGINGVPSKIPNIGPYIVTS